MKKGFTLTETLVVVALIAITLSIGLPALSSFRERIQARQSATELHQLISYTRSQSILLAQRVTLCPLDNSNACSSDWNGPLSVFTDLNNNRVMDADETLLKVMSAVQSSNELRAFNSKVISFDHLGFAGFNNGTLSYCLNGATTSGSAYIISRNGRMRLAGDKNNDGLPELLNGKTIDCPAAGNL